MTTVVKPYRDPVPGRGSIELRRTAAGVYSWVITIWTDAIVTDAHLLGMVDSVEQVDGELRSEISLRQGGAPKGSVKVLSRG